MIPELGHFAMALAVALAVAQAVLPLWGAARDDARLMATAAPLATGQLIAMLASFGALIWCYVVSDFTVLNVANNSHSLKPLLYKITGTWGNHEGSLLLWCLMLSACAAAVAAFGARLPTRLRARVIGVLGLVAAGFLLFALLTSNPFIRIWPPPVNGRDLNPLLQDPGLAFHPPLLYAGYVGFSIAFAFAVAALLEGRLDAAWGRWVRPWTLAAWAFLTGGIALGSWWAYYELGWGGYWFWDPVENASLLPWLTGTALLHSAIVVEKREALRIWTVLLAIASFSLSLMGTFLVRSGVLNSVHAFANDPTRGMFILALLATTIGGALALFAWRAPKLAPTGLFSPISREGALVVNNVLLCTITSIVLVGTLWPLVADLLFDAKFSVGAPFFNSTIVWVALPLLAVMAIGPLLPWKRASLADVARKMWPACIVAVLVGGFALWGTGVLPALGFALSVWLVLGAMLDIAGRARFRLGRLGAIPRATWGTAVAHIGMAVTIAGICGMSQATETTALMRPGETRTLAGYDWTLTGVADRAGPNYAARAATLELRRNGALITVLRPERHSFATQQMTTTEAAIHTNGLADFYAVLGEERDGAAVMRLHYNPLAPWIWIGALIMALGAFLSLSDRSLRVGAPRRAAARSATTLQEAAS